MSFLSGFFPANCFLPFLGAICCFLSYINHNRSDLWRSRLVIYCLTSSTQKSETLVLFRLPDEHNSSDPQIISQVLVENFQLEKSQLMNPAAVDPLVRNDHLCFLVHSFGLKQHLFTPPGFNIFLALCDISWMKNYGKNQHSLYFSHVSILTDPSICSLETTIPLREYFIAGHTLINSSRGLAV